MRDHFAPSKWIRVKMNCVNIKSSTFTDLGVGNNDKNPKFEISDHVKISKYENIFAKGYTSNWSKKVKKK